MAVNVINSTTWLHAVAALDQRGVDRTKVRFTEVPFPQMNDPLFNGQLDAVLPGRAVPFGADGDRQGRNLDLDLRRDRTRVGHHSIHRARAVGREEPRDGGEVRARGERRGAVRASNEAATRDINLAYTGLNPALKDKVLLPELGTAVNVAGMARTMELMQKYGLLKTPIDISRRVLASLNGR